jgi:hypothetical protein
VNVNAALGVEAVRQQSCTSRRMQKMALRHLQPGYLQLHSRVMVYIWLGFTFFMAAQSESNRDRENDRGSILEIINTQEVQRLLAARKENVSREERRYLGENALDDGEVSEEDTSTDKEPEDDILQQMNFAGNRKSATRPPGNSFKGHTVEIGTLVRKSNETFPHSSQDILGELGGYTGEKLLKSSKNALLVTKKDYLKRDWCKTEPLVQRIREDGCITRTVVNRFCYGQCNSFYIPKNARRRKSRHRESDEEEDDEDWSNAPAFKSCAFCKPKKAAWITVALNCPSQVPQVRKRRILRIKQCKCITEVFN